MCSAHPFSNSILMASEVMTHAQATFLSMFAQNSTPFKCTSGALRLRIMPSMSTVLGGHIYVTQLKASPQSSKCKSAGRMVVSILGEPRVGDSKLNLAEFCSHGATK